MKRRRIPVSVLEIDSAGESPFPGGELQSIVREASCDRLGVPRRDWWMSGADFSGGDYIE